MYMETLHFLICTHCTSKHEESQRYARFYFRHNNATTFSLDVKFKRKKVVFIFLHVEIFTADLQ